MGVGRVEAGAGVQTIQGTHLGCYSEGLGRMGSGAVVVSTWGG